MGLTLFERNIEQSFIDFDKVNNTMVTGKQMLHTFFEDKVSTLYPSFERRTFKKIAVVLFGQSCCGKSTFAKNFVKQNPEFSILSMDECAHKHITTLSPQEKLILSISQDTSVVDSYGNTLFGEALENGDNLVIDGCWLFINARSALFKTLHQLGYHICLVSFLNIDPKEYEARVIGRCLDNVARNMLDMDLFDAPFGTDFVALYASKRNLSIDQAKLDLVHQPIFKEHYSDQLLYLQNEVHSSVLQEQVNMQMIYMGAEEFIDLFS